MKIPRPLAGLVLGHFSIDFWQGALPALLPLLHTERHWTLAANGTLLFAFNFASSIVQPLFGLASDARPRAWLMPAEEARRSTRIHAASAESNLRPAAAHRRASPTSLDQVPIAGSPTATSSGSSSGR